MSTRSIQPRLAQLGVTSGSQILMSSNGTVSYSGNMPVDTLGTTGAKAGDVLYVDSKGQATWGNPLEMEAKRFLKDPFLKDSYEKYRAAKAELIMRIKLQKDAEDEQ